MNASGHPAVSTTRFSQLSIVIVCLLVLHVYSLLLPFVNQEIAFNSAAGYFRSGDRSLIEAFFTAEANAVVVPTLGAALSVLFGSGAEMGCRILSLICLAGLLASLARLPAGQGHDRSWYVVALIVLNPLLWTYAGRGTADFAPAALAATSIALSWLSRGDPLKVAAAIILFALACLTKVHAILLLPLVALSPDAQSLKWRAMLVVSTGIAAVACLAIYYVAVFRTFGFWFTPPQFQSIHAPSAQHIFGNAVRYCGYLALLALPFSAALVLREASRRELLIKFAVIMAAFAAGALLPPSAGEMNFGPFDRWVGGWFAASVLSMLCVVFLLSLYDREQSWIDRGLAASLLLFIVVLSFSRPAQRYLIFILPFYYLLMFRRQRIRTYLAVPTLALFVVLNIAVAVVQMRAPPGGPGTVFGPARQF